MNLKRILKSSTSVVLAFLMMFSTMLVGTVTTNAATTLSDEQMKSILDGSQVMVYAGENSSWNQTSFGIYNSSHSIISTQAGSAIDYSSYKLNTLLVPPSTSGTNYVSHTAWSNGGNQFTGGVKAGYAYLCLDGTSGNAATTYAGTTSISSASLASSTIAKGGSTSISVTIPSTTSWTNNSHKLMVYTSDGTKILDQSGFSGTTSSFTLSNLSTLDSGTYTLYPVVTDGNIYVRGNALSLTVSLPHSLSFSAGENGTMTVNGSSTSPITVEEGATYTANITPNTGYAVDTFTVNGVDKKSDIVNNVYAGTVGAGDITLNATFKAVDYNVTAVASPVEGGTVTVNGGSTTTANIGDVITLANTPNAEYQFVKYTDGNGQDLTLNEDGNYVMTASDVNIIAKFEKIKYNITATAENGTIKAYVNDSATASTTYSAGDKVKFVITPNTGYSLSQFMYNDTDVTADVADLTYTVNSAPTGGVTASATCAAATYNLSYVTVQGGTVTGPATAHYGDTITVTVTANTGYTCASVQAGGATVTDNKDGTYTFAMPAEDVSVIANINSKDVTAPAVTINGQINSTTALSGVGNSLLLTPLTTVNDTYAVVDNANCSFTSITKDGVEVAVSNYLTDAELGKNFKASEPGTYVVTYTGTAKSTVDATKTASNTAKITINVTYTGTQQAYVNLKNSLRTYAVDESKYDTSSSYWTTYKTAYDSANELSGSTTTLPAYTDTDSSKYTNAQTALANAYNDLDNCLNQTQFYALTKYSSNVYLQTWSRSADCTLGVSNALTLLGSCVINGTTYYLWNISFTGTTNGCIYVDQGGNWYDNKLTTDITTATTKDTSYYFDVKNITAQHLTDGAPQAVTASPYNRTSINNITAPSGVITAGTVMNLTTTVPSSVKASTLETSSGASVTLSYYIDGVMVSDPSAWTATSGNHTLYVQADCGIKNGTTSTSMESSQSNTVNFTVGKAYDITCVNPSTGSLEAYVNNIKVTVAPAGASVTVKAVNLDATKYLAGITATGVEAKDITDNGDNTYTFTMPEANVTVNPVLKSYPDYTVSMSNSTQGSISASYNSGTAISSGDSVNSIYPVKFVATPNSGYEFGNWKFTNTTTGEDVTDTITYVSGSKLSQTAEVMLTSDITATAVYTEHSFYLADIQSGNGSTRGISASTVLSNKSATFSVESVDGDVVTYVCATPVPANHTFTVHDGTNLVSTSVDGNQYWFTSTNMTCTNPTWASTTTGAYFYDSVSSSSQAYKAYFTYNKSTEQVTSVYVKAVPTYTVNMSQGISSDVNGAMGTSYLENTTSKTTVTKTFDSKDFEVDTQVNSTFTDGSKTDYTYKVQGYSMLITYADGTKATKSILESNVTYIGSGKYSAHFSEITDDVKTIDVTPVFSISQAYADYKGLSYTTLYLKYTPGDTNFLSGTYEPLYYTWRGNEDDKQAGKTQVNVTNSRGESVSVERQPEGAYGGQKMLYVGNGMFVVEVQSNLSGILFDDSSTNQTLDYNEFIKLQELGYDNITFEPRKSSDQTIINQLNTSFGSAGNKVYTGTTASGVNLSDSARNSQFVLDVSLDGYYIDAFGNFLVDTDGKKISKEDLKAESGATTVTAELNALLSKMGKSSDALNALYAARFGDTNQKTGYDMFYGTRVYYFDNKLNMVSQQVSGYGTIEGAKALNGQTNAQAYSPLSWKYYEGSTNSEVGTFTTGYELIAHDYEGLPFMVSYRQPTKNGTNTRIDGKWYYQREIPEVTITAKAGLMNEDGSLAVQDGKLISQDATVGTGTVNGESSVTVGLGDTVTLQGETGQQYKFVGFYTEDGTIIESDNPYDMMAASDQTIFAVFQKIGEGSLVVTNNIYRGTNPQDGGGNGTLSVALLITHNGTTTTYSGTNTANATIEDGDTFRWVITGKAKGIDTFKAFREPETDVDGRTYYVELDDPSCLEELADVTWRYTSVEQEWNWYQQVGTGDKYKTINLFTDFNKVSAYAQLTYKYVDRFGVEKSYVVSNVPLSYEEIANKYIPSDATVLANAPYIDDIYKDAVWNVTDVEKITKTSSKATIVATQAVKTYSVYVDHGDEIAVLETDSAEYNSLLTVVADKTMDGKDFSYWMAYNVDDQGNPVGDGQIVATDTRYSYRVTKNILIVAVYGDEKPEQFIAAIDDAVYTREVTTDAQGQKHDYVYTDFLVQFEYAFSGHSFKDVASGAVTVPGVNNVKFGVISEIDTTASGFDPAQIVAPVTVKSYLVDTILSLNNNLQSGGTASGWNATAPSTEAQYDYYYTAYDLRNRVNELSNMGRLDFALKNDNTEANRKLVYNVYNYVIYSDDNGDQHVIVSTPKVKNIYDAGTKDPDITG